MSTITTPTDSFLHEALLYAGEQEFLDGTVPFVRDGVAAGEPVLVVVAGEKIALLREALGDDAGGVRFADMARLGDNPARLIPAWLEFLDEHPGGAARGIGEPVHPQRTAPALAECHRHESLLNLALADRAGLSLLCPYDTALLDPAVVHEAHRTHPHVRAGGVARESPWYEGLAAAAAPFTAELPEPPAGASELTFDIDSLSALRASVAAVATAAGMDAEGTSDLVLAVGEVAGNSIRHAGGCGVLRLWLQGGALVCDVRDDGRIADPLVGRRRPEGDQIGGYGLWLANQVCDLVQIRVFADGGAVRLHKRLT
jgi:anti-sigma regulatory factor (Ser/Thr protein kinase)